MSMPDKPAHDWESPASRKASPNGEVGQPPIPPDRNCPAPGETPPQDDENVPSINGFDWEASPPTQRPEARRRNSAAALPTGKALFPTERPRRTRAQAVATVLPTG